MPKAGNLFGTTRCSSPACLGLRRSVVDENFRRSSSLIAHAEGAIFSSLGMTLSRRKSFGRFPRSVEMITHRPVIGSLRNSGKAILLEDVLGYPRGLGNLETLNCTASGVLVKIVPVSPSHLRLNASLCNRTTGAARGSINCHYVKPAGTLADVTFRQKSLRRANHHVLFLLVMLSSGSAGKSSRMVRVLTFDECQRLAVVTTRSSSP